MPERNFSPSKEEGKKISDIDIKATEEQTEGPEKSKKQCSTDVLF